MEKTDYEAHYRLLLPDGTIKYQHSIGGPIVNEKGDLVEFVATAIDVTEQAQARIELEKAFEEIKQRTEAARRSERELRDVVNTVPAYVWSTSPEGQVDFVNDRWLQFTGLALPEAFGRKWEAVLHPDDRTRVVADWHTAVKNGQAMESEARVRRADGEYCWWFIRTVPLRDETGKLVRWYGTAVDIEDRKRAEQALRKSEERWRSVFENTAIGVALTDLNGRFLATNQVYQTIVGYTEEELRALYFLDLTHEDYREANCALITELLEGKRRQFQIEKKYRRKDGTSIWVSNNVSLVPGTERVPRFIMALSEDITQRKRAEEALRSHEQNLRLLVDTIPGLVVTTTPAGEIEHLNRQVLEYFDKTPEELVNWRTSDAVHPDDLPLTVAALTRAIQTGEPYEVEHRLRRADGAYRWFHTRGLALRDKEGRIERWYYLPIDVDDRRRAEEALRKSEERGRSVFENSAIGVTLTDLNGRFLAANHVYQTIVGYTEEELRAVNFLDLTHEDYRQANWALITELVEGKRRQFQIEKKYRRKDGSSIWVSNNVSLVQGTERVPRFIMALSEDITQRKRAEEALQRSDGYLAEAQKLTHTGSWAAQVSLKGNVNWSENVDWSNVYWSKEMYRIFGFDPDPTPPSAIEVFRRLHPEDAPNHPRMVERAIRDGTDFEMDYRLLLPDG